ELYDLRPKTFSYKPHCCSHLYSVCFVRALLAAAARTCCRTSFSFFGFIQFQNPNHSPPLNTANHWRQLVFRIFWRFMPARQCLRHAIHIIIVLPEWKRTEFPDIVM